LNGALSSGLHAQKSLPFFFRRANFPFPPFVFIILSSLLVAFPPAPDWQNSATPLPFFSFPSLNTFENRRLFSFFSGVGGEAGKQHSRVFFSKTATARQVFSFSPFSLCSLRQGGNLSFNSVFAFSPLRVTAPSEGRLVLLRAATLARPVPKISDESFPLSSLFSPTLCVFFFPAERRRGKRKISFYLEYTGRAASYFSLACTDQYDSRIFCRRVGSWRKSKNTPPLFF